MNFIVENIKKSFNMTLLLVKILLPVSILVKLLEITGIVEKIAIIMSPIMKFIGLPGEFGIVWITGMLTNIYGAMIALSEISDSSTFSIAQMNILALMILVAHSMLTETNILKKAGGKVPYLVGIRVISAYFIGGFLHLFLSVFNLYNSNAVIIWTPKKSDPTIIAWIVSQIRNYFYIYLMILFLLILMKILEITGILNMVHKILTPILDILGMSKYACNINLIGLTMGISYSGAMLIEESKSQHLTKKDLVFSIIFISLCHALIEDSILMAAIGADALFIGIFRLVFVLLFLYLMNVFKIIEKHDVFIRKINQKPVSEN